MTKKVSITLEFKDVLEFNIDEDNVSVKFKTEDGGWEFQNFPAKDVKSFYNYGEDE
jgi:hypothetical protein